MRKVRRLTVSITELTELAKKQSETMTREDKIDLLRNANIIGEDGYYPKKYFSRETVEKDRRNGIPLVK